MTLAEYLVNRLAAYGLVANDVSLVEWNDPDFGWLPVDRASFIAVAQQVQVGQVSADARERLRFNIVTNAGVERVAQWNNDSGDFELVPEAPPIYVVSTTDLTT